MKVFNIMNSRLLVFYFLTEINVTENHIIDYMFLIHLSEISKKVS